MRSHRPRRLGHLAVRFGLIAVSLMACLLVACGAAPYSKTAYAEPGGIAPPSPPMVAAAGMPADAAKEERGYTDDAAGAAPVAPTSKAGPPPARTSDERLAESTAEGDKKASPSTPSTGTPGAPAQIAADVGPIRQMLIYTAQLRMAVFETHKSLLAVEDLARELGGFLSRRTDNEITIRIPVERFDEATKRISGQGDVLTRNVQVEDVTEQYLDVSLRLKNARQVRERIAQLLANAKTVEESLEVERELNRLSGEIERLEGRLKYLGDRARYSTITVTFQAIQKDDVNPNKVFQLPFPWLEDLGLGRLMTLR